MPVCSHHCTIYCCGLFSRPLGDFGCRPGRFNYTCSLVAANSPRCYPFTWALHRLRCQRPMMIEVSSCRLDSSRRTMHELDQLPSRRARYRYICFCEWADELPQYSRHCVPQGSVCRCQLLRRQAMDVIDAHQPLLPKIPSCYSIFTALSVHHTKLAKKPSVMFQKTHRRIGR